MSIENVKLSKEELDWIQLRKELDEIRGNDAKKSSFSMETWYIPVGKSRLKDEIFSNYLRFTY